MVYVGPSSRGIPRGHLGTIFSVTNEGPSPISGLGKVPRCVLVKWDEIPGAVCQTSMSGVGVEDIRDADTPYLMPPELPPCFFPTQPGTFICKLEKGVPQLAPVYYDMDSNLSIRVGISNFPLKDLERSAKFWGPLHLEEPFKF